MTVRRHVIVTGQVQGVGFRYAAQAEATRLHLDGFARNLPDGSVEVEIEGSEESVARMLQWLATGPAWARVDGLDTREVAERGETGFDIRR
jgi:acylphosphatase